MRQGLLYIACILFLALMLPGRAESAGPEATQFFSSIQDMPLMPGLSEMTDQMLVFDKPEGRIVESLALVESGSSAAVEKYYAEVLPQFGWQRIAGNSFVREGEQLQIGFESFEGRQFMRVMLTPRPANP